MIKFIKKPAKFNYFTYIGDYQGCGYIRVLIPSILINQTRFDGYKVRSSYHDHFINDMGFYNKLSFVQFQRAYTDQHYKLIHHFNVNVSKMTKTPILYEIDDMLIGIPEWNYASDFYRKHEDNVKKILGIVRGVTCSTDKLKSIYSEYNNNITVIPNHLAKFLWGNIERKEQRDGKPRILYAGSQNHFCTEKLKKQGKSGGDFGPELIDFIRKTTDKYQWVFVGGNPMELDDLIDSGKIEYHGWQSILSLPQFLKSLNVDIGLAPLMKNTFNEGKSNIKALEYAALGIPGIYTNIEPYKDMMFTCDTDIDMIDSIESVATDIDMRNRVYEHDYDVVKEQLFWEDHDNIKKYINSYLSLFNKKMED